MISELFYESEIYNQYLRVLINFQDTFYKHVNLEDICRRILPELLNENTDSLNDSLLCKFIRGGLKSKLSESFKFDVVVTNEVKQQKMETKSNIFSSIAGVINEALSSDTFEGVICAGKAYICLLIIDISLANELLNCEQVLEKIPLGENEKLDEIFIVMESKCIGSSLLQPTEEFVNFILQMLLSDNQNNQAIAESAINDLFCLQNQELHSIIWEYLMNCFNNDENTPDFNLFILDLMLANAFRLEQSICEAIFPEIISLIETLTNSSEVQLYISRLLGILAMLGKILGNDFEEFTQKALEITSLYIEDYEDDCLFTFNIIIQAFNQITPEILNCCYILIKQRLEKPNTILPSSIVKLTDDEEFLVEFAKLILQTVESLQEGEFFLEYNGLFSSLLRVPESEVIAIIKTTLFKPIKSFLFCFVYMSINIK
ncbi:hypothetical protein TVAG_108230 [Trichomonas vaginalis G3]|uniref:Uncharacterized protein n=1 Tax=Trichomonas vaginalis (strain ATCC PRA-98 / G3) TaxID=412133 RepID=A2EQE7_TRIV3|nr:hypothetical protein TVAG_108230 [Trichomonas vaginalis G3]|eukprot:XP_001317312.1 hypothetical protein [Trichomonas vaginalis G3]